MSIAPCSRTAVLGPSGEGKSTLLSLVAGFISPEQGAVRWQGTDLTPQRPGERPVSIVFQDSNLFPHLTVTQNVGMGLSPNLRLSQAQSAQLAAVLDQVGLADYGDRKPGALSGGQRARAALARVLLRERPILLLDEAFSALGPALKAEMFDLMEETLPPETILLMVTHDPDEAARMDQIIVVSGGQADAPQDTAPLLANPPPALASYLGK
ncbi:MAG: ATP-binding cassette domain-containing protein [Rhodobacteraceae bacterium]|nr:ATP-binding cassette domain-containing protein [Paracoccaceae bacterium]